MARPKQDLVRANFNAKPEFVSKVKQFAEANESTVTETVLGSLDLLLALAAAWDNGCDVLVRAPDGSESIVPLPVYGLAKTVERFSSNHNSPAAEA